jgi:hypothetical protein
MQFLDDIFIWKTSCFVFLKHLFASLLLLRFVVLNFCVFIDFSIYLLFLLVVSDFNF